VGACVSEGEGEGASEEVGVSEEEKEVTSSAYQRRAVAPPYFYRDQTIAGADGGSEKRGFRIRGVKYRSTTDGGGASIIDDHEPKGGVDFNSDGVDDWILCDTDGNYNHWSVQRCGHGGT